MTNQEQSFWRGFLKAAAFSQQPNALRQRGMTQMRPPAPMPSITSMQGNMAPRPMMNSAVSNPQMAQMMQMMKMMPQMQQQQLERQLAGRFTNSPVQMNPAARLA